MTCEHDDFWVLQVASVTGDVRRALEICRQAAQIAEREEADIVDAGGTPEPNSVSH